jgi:hypothetical protein
MATVKLPVLYTTIRTGLTKAVEELDIVERAIRMDEQLSVTSGEHADVSMALANTHHAITTMEKRWHDHAEAVAPREEEIR